MMRAGVTGRALRAEGIAAIVRSATPGLKSCSSTMSGPMLSVESSWSSTTWYEAVDSFNPEPLALDQIGRPRQRWCDIIGLEKRNVMEQDKSSMHPKTSQV